nr:hypothetical protein [Polymorphobacter sp.]
MQKFPFRLVVMLVSALILVSPAASADELPAIIGTWIVKDGNAPFPYHMYVFNADGTMQQANPDAGNPKRSDSDGKGVWKLAGERVHGKWVEIMADRATHKFVGIGEISFEIVVKGDRFEGQGSASFYDGDRKLIDGPFATTMSGTRVTLE